MADLMRKEEEEKGEREMKKKEKLERIIK